MERVFLLLYSNCSKVSSLHYCIASGFLSLFSNFTCKMRYNVYVGFFGDISHFIIWKEMQKRHLGGFDSGIDYGRKNTN